MCCYLIVRSGVMLRALSSVEKGGIHQLDDDIERLIYS